MAELHESIRTVREWTDELPSKPLAYVHTFGCQLNVADGEKLAGLLQAMGYGMTDDAEQASLILCVTGCMTAQPTVAEKLRKSYPYVDIVLGSNAVQKLPEMLCEHINGKRFAWDTDVSSDIPENVPTARDSTFKAAVPVMYGCNNFCTYCIVPDVRGRERSRQPEAILDEVRGLIEAGYKEIMLLGQNVNSYGKDLPEPWDFADLLAAIDQIPGDYLIRFMSSQPKDATHKLFDTMARCRHVAPQLHLPVQSGSDRVLKVMNRSYTRQKYLDQVALARRYMPDLVLTTDIIVGFPGETEEEFQDTLSLCEQVRYDAMFTFIYSKRVGTPAASMPDPFTRADKQRHFDALTELSNRISGEKHKAYEGRTLRVLVDGETGRDEYNLSSRTDGGRLVHLKGDPSLVGQFVEATITASNTWALYGEIKF